MASTTIEAKIVDALKARLLALTLSPALQIAWPNVAFTPPTGAYLRVTNMQNTTSRAVIADDGPQLNQGIFQIDVMAPLGEGEASLDTGAQIAAWFGAGTRLPFTGGQVRIVDPPNVTSMKSGDGIRWMITVSVPWLAYA
jgi:hypothetical protein